MTVFPASYSLPTHATKSASKGALASRHMLKVEPGEHMKTGQVRCAARGLGARRHLCRAARPGHSLCAQSVRSLLRGPGSGSESGSGRGYTVLVARCTATPWLDCT